MHNNTNEDQTKDQEIGTPSKTSSNIDQESLILQAISRSKVASKHASAFNQVETAEAKIEKEDTGSLTLEWEDVNVFTPGGKYSKQILFNQKGSVKSGKVLAIIGASGSGKTTLLNFLSGYIDSSMSFDGVTRIGGVEGLDMSKLRSICGYVLQHDILSPELTVEETIQYSAKFRLPQGSTPEQIKEKVNSVIKMLELEKCRDTKIGDGIDRGVSGGERKRAVIGAEIVTDPKLLLLDEPTTGLDSVNAENVVLALKEMAKRDKIVVTTIHQPSVELLELFDQILILHEGKKVYMGRFGDMRDFFKDNGIEIPEFSNPVEFILNILNLDPHSCKILEEQVSSEFSEIYNPKTIEKMHKIIEMNQKQVMVYTMNHNEELVNRLIQEGKERRKTFWYSFILLFVKYWTIFLRNKEGIFVRFIMAISQVGLAAILYWDMQFTERDIQNRKGALYYVMMFSAMMTLQAAAFSFGTGMELLKKELLQGQYSPLAYFFGRTLAPFFPHVFILLLSSNGIFYITNMNGVNISHVINFNLLIFFGILSAESIGLFLAAAFRDPERTIALVPIFITPLSLFAGLLVDIGSIPGILSPFKYISFFRFLYEGLIINEFTDINGCVPAGICDVPKDQMSFDDSVEYCIIVLALITGVSRILAAIMFHFGFKKFSQAK